MAEVGSPHSAASQRSTISNLQSLRIIALVSGIYDALIGIVMLTARPLLAQIFSVPLPAPPIHADLNGVFLLAVAAGYLIPYRDPASAGGRAYLWTMGPFLKGAGALAFVVDRYARHSPASFLLFALSDGVLALVTGLVLVASRNTPERRRR